MANPEAIERGMRLYEALIRANYPQVECRWSLESIPATLPAGGYGLTVIVKNRGPVKFGPVTFADLELLATYGNPKIEQRVREIMASIA
jgi:hypothetical protein